MEFTWSQCIENVHIFVYEAPGIRPDHVEHEIQGFTLRVLMPYVRALRACVHLRVKRHNPCACVCRVRVFVCPNV